MDLETLKRAIAADPQPPPDLGAPLAGLWLDAAGDWEEAHRRVQSDEGPEAAWVHAYLHRKEGDLSNAGYWYRRAGRSPAEGSLEAEWDALAAGLLEGGHP